jgi:CRISPR system Cascade subunit CasA
VTIQDSPPTFNLWTREWIELEKWDGSHERRGIAQALLQAHTYRGIYEQSPLVVAGIHRLLVAVLQFALKPDTPPKLRHLWKLTQFPSEAILQFGSSYADRFDLFSSDQPFMQSKSLSLTRKKKDPKPKSVAYLAPEVPTGNNIIHFRHGSQETDIFCPMCAASGLVVMPMFTTIGGPGVPAAINGTPPIYVLPSGKSLFHSLRASLVTRAFQPAQTVENDLVWWVRDGVVERGKKDVRQVGYLHGLTFTPRMIRLYPVRDQSSCTRCGRTSDWMIKEIIYEKGESRAKDEPWWRDPFTAYYPLSKESQKNPKAITPQAGRALWRDYAGLFLPLPEDEQQGQPAMLRQIAQLGLPDTLHYPFRCIGLRTEQMKFFEWIDEDAQIPLRLLHDMEHGQWVRGGLDFAEKCAAIIANQFARSFGKKTKDHERYQSLKMQMLDAYWSVLAQPFRSQFVRDIASDTWATAYRRWIYDTRDEAFRQFQRAAADAGKDARYFATRARAEAGCWKQLYNASFKFLKGVPET